MFDRLLLVACVLIVAALILYFFFWNRFIAFVLVQIIRVLYWNQEASSVWIEIGSIHFSLLAGRILVRGIRYHSSNQTIKIVKGQIQWRYWLRRPITEDDIGLNRGEEDPCRIHISMQGFEWFLYNRTAAFDSIVAQMDGLSRTASGASGPQRSTHRTATRDSSSPFYPSSRFKRATAIPVTIQNAMNWFKMQMPNLDPKELLPLGLEVSKGAIVCGNSSTSNLLVAEFQNTEGTFGVIPSKSKHDLYKQLLSLKFKNASIRYVHNDDYVDSMTTIGNLVHNRIAQHPMFGRVTSYLSFKSFVRIWRQIGMYILATRYSETRRAQRSAQQALATSTRVPKKTKKVIEEETPVGIDFSAYEYAIERQILEAPVLKLTYYVDVVGDVPDDPEPSVLESIDVGNGDTSPEWGFDIVIHGGVIRYGPWADRARAELQRIFFPPTYQNAVATPRLSPGEKRTWTALQVFVELRDETTLHIPFRESSKDWQWDGLSDIPDRPKRREAASLNVSVGDRSSINYFVPLVATSKGYDSIVEVHLDTVLATSTLNDIRLVNAESCRVRGEMPTPLRWNDVRTWSFAISLRQPILYLLRDHINMFTDLGRDWASGPPTDWQKFVPTLYGVDLDLHHYELNLYANDQNIIDKPLIPEENALLVLHGLHVKTNVNIPLNSFRPESTIVNFIFEAPDISADFSLPRWSTHALHAPKLGYKLLHAKFFEISGSYRYYTEVRDELMEQLKLSFELREVACRALGWSIRYFMVLRDNYFGSFTHFSTLLEYLSKRERGLAVGDPLSEKYREGKSNMMQVEMSLVLNKVALLLQAGLLGYESPSSGYNDIDACNVGSCIVMHVSEAQLQLRLHDYYMEMSLNLGIVRGYIEPKYSEKVVFSRPMKSSQEIFIIDGIDIVANRLFGPQPNTTTYFCVWEIRLGHVKSALSVNDGELIIAAAKSFGLNFADVANAPADEYLPAVDPDVTFLKVTLKSLDVTWRAGCAALNVAFPQGLRFDSNDLGTLRYKKVTAMVIPIVQCRVLFTARSQQNHRWLEAADFVIDVYVDMYDAPSGFLQRVKEQHSFVHEQDKTTHRVQRLLDQLRAGYDVNASRSDHVHNVYLPQVKIPFSYATTVSAHDTPKVPFTENRSGVKQPGWPLSSQESAEESEAEEAVSEADRDARLAKSRSLTPLPVFVPEAEDINLTSGEESDDADLTGGESSDSDWMETFSDDSDISNIRFYSRLTRHYVTNRLGVPGLWEGPSFLVIKERPFLFKLKDEKSSEVSELPLSSPIAEVTPTESRKTICLQFRRRLEVRITPLVVQALKYVEEDLRKSDTSPELCIDSLVSRHLSRFSSQKDTAPHLVLDVSVPLTTIQVLQHVAMEGGYPLLEPKIRRFNMVSNLDRPAVLEVSMQGMHIIGSVGTDANLLKAFVQKLGLRLHLPTDRRSMPMSSDVTIFDVTLSNSTTELARDRLQICTEIFTKMGHQGPEFLVSVANSTISNAEHAIALLQTVMHRSSSRARDIISCIIRASHGKSILDPLSTIQPSYLIQSGIPHQLRTDVTFKFLFHLRNSVWTLDKKDREHFLSALEKDAPVSLEEFGQLLESRLSALDQDAYDISHLTFLEQTFSDATSPKHPNKSTLFSFIALQMNSTYIAIVDHTGSPSAELSLSNMHAVAELRKLEVLQSASYIPSSMSQASLRSKGSKSLKKWTVNIFIESLTSAVQPHLIHFAQRILRVRQHSQLQSPKIPGPSIETSSFKALQLTKIDLILSLQRFRFQAAAAKLTVEFGILGVQITANTITTNDLASESTNTSIMFKKCYLRARSSESTKRPNVQDILASFDIRDGKLNVLGRQEHPSRPQLKAIFSLGSFLLSVPRSALHLYRFVEEWRADFLTGIEATLKSLVSEARTDQANDSRTPFKIPILHIHGQIVQFEISLQIMHGTWLTWEIRRTIGYIQSSHIGSHIHAFGLQLSSMHLNISSTKNISNVPPDSRVKLVFPSLSLAGDFNGTRIHALVLMDFIELKLKPSHWDTLLAVQQKFGQDFNDLVILMQKSQSRKSRETVPERLSDRSLRYSGFLKMRGFRVGLESLASTVFLECSNVGGGVNNATGWAWDIALSGLTLSLSQRTTVHAYGISPTSRRSAFVTIDFRLSAEESIGKGEGDNTIQLIVSKMHAVMQPSSIGEVGDFIDHLQAEVLERKEQRALELATFKEKARSILKTFDVNIGETQLDETSSLLSDYVVKVVIHSIGVAFPLTTDDKLEPLRNNHTTRAVRAFIFSIKSIEFTTYRGETGQASMKNFSFVFTSKFSQSVASHFSAETHNTRNRLVYPEMKAQLRTSKSANSREVWIGANVSGFILDLDSSIPDYVFSLVDVYRQGKDRMERLSAQLPRTPSTLTPTLETGKRSLEQHYSTIPTSNIFGSLTFLSGKVRVYSNSALTNILSRCSADVFQELTDDQLLEFGTEVFKLPILTVWSEYRATPASQKLNSDKDQEPSVLMFKATVHSSHNTLRPKLLPFVTELVDHVETRLRKVSSQIFRPASLTQVASYTSQRPSEELPPVSSMRITFSLRIDRSRLELTCQPDVNVVAGLHWDSGGFVVSISPGARKVTFTGSVSGLKIGLKHGFLSEDCLNLDARNLAFSMSFAKVESSLGHPLGFISVVLDTEFHGGVRFSRLQDILCFKAVWLDRIPVFNSQIPTDDAVPMKPFDPPPIDSSIPKEGLSTVILLRIRQIKLDVDLGQSISSLSLDLKPAILQTKLTDLASEVSIYVGEVVLSATGNLSGHVYVPKCVFQTIRRSETAVVDSEGHGRMLELRMTSGTLVASLESDGLKLLHYRAEPLEVEIHDDWSKTSPVLVDDERPLQLSFTVASTEIVAIVMVGTIPKLLSYANKFRANLQVQRLGASRESALFRATRSPKPDNPLSAVAEAMLLSARARFKEAGAGLAYAIKQHISLRLDFLRLVVFPRTMEDTEIAQFIGKDVRARLDRYMATEAKPALRDLHLSFSSMTISKYTHFGHPALGVPRSWDELDKNDWMDSFLKYASEATIVGLPSMKMHMVSEEVVEGLVTTLVYDFYSEFVRREGMKALEDIYITLNVSLYSWLTLLRKNLTREMDQVKAAEEWRNLLAGTDAAIPAGATQRKKSPPEPLSLSPSVETQKSFTLPTQPNLSLMSSDSTRFSVEQTRSITGPVPSNQAQSPTLHGSSAISSPIPFPVVQDHSDETPSSQPKRGQGAAILKYQPRNRHIERLTMRQLGEATPDVMHPFFMKKSGFNLEDSLPQYVYEYATVPLEEIMDLLLKLYSRQLSNKKHGDTYIDLHN
ncbi:hypothetical protein BDQ17DRAFT_1496756 [Cyathus striatus]|nr:hypothetical protein BDQ17DRAFT_1496756 [Cyathus striatus]